MSCHGSASQSLRFSGYQEYLDTTMRAVAIDEEADREHLLYRIASRH